MCETCDLIQQISHLRHRIQTHICIYFDDDDNQQDVVVNVGSNDIGRISGHGHSVLSALRDTAQNVIRQHGL